MQPVYFYQIMLISNKKNQVGMIPIVSSSSPSTNQVSLIMPPSTSASTQLTNLIITPSSSTVTSGNHVTSYIISNSGNTATGGTSLLVPTCSVSGSTISTPVNMILPQSSVNGNNSQMTSIMLPVGSAKSNFVQHVTISNGKITHSESKSQSNVKDLKSPNSITGFSPIPPLQPITGKESTCNSIIQLAKTNGINVPDSLIMTPINDDNVLLMNKDKENEKTLNDSVEIEMMPVEKSEGTVTSCDEKDIKISPPALPSSDHPNLHCDEIFEPADIKDDLVLDGEVTVRRLVADNSGDAQISSKQVSVDDFNIEIVKLEKCKEQEKKLDKPVVTEDIDPMKVIQWDQNGIGTLPGSNLRFRMNEFGMMLVLDNWSEVKDELDSVVTSSSSSRRNSEEKHLTSGFSTKSKSQEDFVHCEGCGCFGLECEFLHDGRFCSIGCKKSVLTQNALKKKRQEDKIRELRIRRRKRKTNLLIKARLQEQSKIPLESKNLTEDEQKHVEAELTVKAWVSKMAEFRNKKHCLSKNYENKKDDDDLTPAASPTSSLDTSVKSETQSQTPADSDVEYDVKEAQWYSNNGEFLWTSYLQYCNKAKSAPVKLFKDPFPFGKNGFKVGMKLEGIDPEHQSCFCVLTVAEVKGYRLRLHFDGYPDNHDFWTNVDSPNIFQPGWCEKNNHRLNPPGFIQEPFSWMSYLKQCRAQPAPKSLFAKSTSAVLPNQFRVGMKLEAVDRKNSSLICVASVADLIDNRLLIHFDSWGDVYDYWTDPSSPYIHPVGWCKENGHNLTPPSTFKNMIFSWDAYLKETKSVAAPARAFKTRPPNLFKRGMKLEAIDKRAPSFLRITTVKDVKDHEILITFDGFPEEFGYWVDDDSPDIHPICWGNKTGHPVECPPNLLLCDIPKSECTTFGCRGDGNIKGSKYVSHQNTFLCPYSEENLNKENLLPDRLCAKPEFYEVPEPEPFKKGKEINNERQEREKDLFNSEPRKTRLSSLPIQEKEEVEEKEKSGHIEEKIERRGRKRKVPEPEAYPDELKRLRKDLIVTVLNPGYKPKPGDVEGWTQHSISINQKVQMTGGDPRRWNARQVAAFVNTVIPNRSKPFIDQEIDGESFLMLSQNDIQEYLGIKLGPAVTIYNCIALLQKKVL
uniref:SAM domain-containing protein n=1 Tax=Clastoptera arizonana TaxID=38151 RepID=A0A1B6E440_9HEMI